MAALRYLVGRYDSDGVGGVSNTGYAGGTVQDAAAFTFRVDSTGHLSVVQYVSLHQPNTASYDEGVFLKAGSLSVNVTVTDGDLDSLTKSADVSASIRFDDDGPHAVVSVASGTLLTIDETAGQDAGTDDVASIAALSGLFVGISGTPGAPI